MIVTIVGKNNYAASLKLREVRNAFVEEFGDSNLVELSAESCTFDDVNAGLVSQGLFSASSMVLLSDIAKNKFMQEQLIEKLESLPEESKLVVYEPNIDRRSSLFKKLKLESVFHDYASLDERDLAKWAVDRYQELGGELGFAEANFLVQRVNLDQWALNNELEKLINMSQPISRKVIEEVVDESFNETIFNLLDLAFSKRAKEAIEGYRNLRKNRVEPHYILSMLVWQLHILAVAVYAGDRSADQIASDNKLSPFVVQKSMRIAARTSKKELKRIIDKTADVDISSKTKATYDTDAAVDNLIASIAS